MSIFRIFAGRRTVDAKQLSIAHDDVRIFRSVVGNPNTNPQPLLKGRGAVCHPQVKHPLVMPAYACDGLLRQVTAAE